MGTVHHIFTKRRHIRASLLSCLVTLQNKILTKISRIMFLSLHFYWPGGGGLSLMSCCLAYLGRLLLDWPVRYWLDLT